MEGDERRWLDIHCCYSHYRVPSLSPQSVLQALWGFGGFLQAKNGDTTYVLASPGRGGWRHGVRQGNPQQHGIAVSGLKIREPEGPQSADPVNLLPVWN